MKHFSWIFFSILLLTSSASSAVVPYITIRSASVDSARQMVGETDKINLYDVENFYLTSALTFEGTRSFDADAIAGRLFGISRAPQFNDKTAIRISGSQVPNRAPTDWLADYFGLSPQYQSTLTFNPRISNLIIDFDFYFGLDEWVPGLYFKAHAPVVATRWDLNFDEIPHNDIPLQGYPAGYFAPSAVPANDLISTATDFFTYRDFPTLTDGVTFEPLSFALLERRRQHKTALAEIQMALGYNFLLCPDYHLGFNFRVDAPTGNRPHARIAFEPIVGNGKHWAVGAGITGHYTFWESCDGETSLGLYVDGNFTHLCRTHQTRTFDLVGRPVSRYMLAEQLGTPVMNLFANPAQGTAANSTVPSAQFKNNFTPVANLTTLPVKSSFPLQADVTALFNYSSCGLSIDVGYNLWALTCERLAIIHDAGPLPLDSGNVWALKGDAFVYGFAAADGTTNPPAPGTPIALSATENSATISSGTNALLTNQFPNQNPGIDNPQFALYSTDNNNDQIVVSPGDSSGSTTQQRTSLDPIFLSPASIDLESGRTRGLSHKLFAHISYTWQRCDTVVPYVGIGGKAEFGPRHAEPQCAAGSSCLIPPVTAPAAACVSCTGCQRTNISEWGVWVKGGIFFS